MLAVEIDGRLHEDDRNFRVGSLAPEPPSFSRDAGDSTTRNMPTEHPAIGQTRPSVKPLELQTNARA